MHVALVYSAANKLYRSSFLRLKPMTLALCISVVLNLHFDVLIMYQHQVFSL